MPGDSARVLTDAPVAASSRSLTTARAVLRVFALLLEHPDGVRADEVAEELGKSMSTAYYLLTSLCEEGFAVHESKGVYRRARGLEELTAAVGEHTHPSPSLHEGLAGSVDELFLRTRKRSYLGVVKAGRIEIVAFRGRQGVPRMPGLGSEIRDSAHALAMGKVVLSLLSPSAVSRYVARGLTAFTPHTITSPDELAAELAAGRSRRLRGRPRGVRRELLLHRGADLRRPRPVRRRARALDDRQRLRLRPRRAGADRRRRRPARRPARRRAGVRPGRPRRAPAPRPGRVNNRRTCKQMRKTASSCQGQRRAIAS